MSPVRPLSCGEAWVRVQTMARYHAVRAYWHREVAMRRSKITSLFYALAAVLAVVLSGAGPAGIARAGLASAPTCGGWSIVPSPRPGQSQGQLMGVAAISST